MRPFAIGDYRDRLVLQTRIGRHTAYLSIPKRADARHAVAVLLAATAGILAALFTMYWLIRRLFRPVQTIRETVQRFGEGDLSRRVYIDRKDELADLGHSINNMADDIQQMLEAKRQLLLAASHELRSPITRARVSTELLDESKLKRNLVKDLAEMETLVAEILETERLNSRHAVLSRHPTSVRLIVDEVLNDHFTGQQVEARLPDDDIYVMIDGPRIKLLMMNLLANAIRHSRHAARAPELAVQIDEDYMRIQVSDHGPGIAPQDIPHVTEPFYRADPARRRDTGGYGLGLYLCRLIAEAHGGSLSIHSRPNEGTTVKVDIPVATASQPTR
jgi:signal transduction histidine kinase